VAAAVASMSFRQCAGLMIESAAASGAGALQTPSNQHCEAHACNVLQAPFHSGGSSYVGIVTWPSVPMAGIIPACRAGGKVYIQTFHTTMYQNCEASSCTKNVNYTALIKETVLAEMYQDATLNTHLRCVFSMHAYPRCAFPAKMERSEHQN
jgi:hypothetical protein